MGKVIVSDIFGRTSALEALAGAVGSVMHIIDPYHGKDMGFAAECAAYDHFMTHVGTHAYEQVLATRLAEIPKIDVLIGFSVGAAAIWGISGTLAPEKISRAVCFYGSQIRHAPDIIPRIRMDHILPEKEPGFDIDDLAAILSCKKNIIVHKTPYLHGFMNRFSPNFNPAGYDVWLDTLRGGRL
jgi:dienelactone hydrolase